MNLPAGLAQLLTPLFEVLPLERAMPTLLVQGQPHGRGADQYEDSTEQAYMAAAHAIESLNDHPELQAGLWLYVDDLERSHTISQNIHTPAGSYWHGIMHRREGDFWNSKYWFRKAGDLGLGLDPSALTDKVEAARGTNTDELLDLQRAEWAALFEKCARNSI